MRIMMLLAVAMLGACAANYGGITTTKLTGEPNGVSAYSSFRVEAVDLPAFLGPVIVSNFSVAMAERGYQPVSSGGDMVATVRYIQENLPVEDDEVRFVARVSVALNPAGSEQILLSGSIQRLHTVQAGEYMHVGDASISFLQAFREMVRDLPPRSGLE